MQEWKRDGVVIEVDERREVMKRREEGGGTGRSENGSGFLLGEGGSVLGGGKMGE
jgi:hypothetical protein